MSILFLVASKKEDLSVIPKLLDVSANPCKPQYHMAAPEPLVLYDCIFNPGENARDSQTMNYYKLIHSHPLYTPLIDGSKAKYNESPCCFDDSLSQQALGDLVRSNEKMVHETAITASRALQLSHVIQSEYKGRVEDVSGVVGDFEELCKARYTLLERRSKARISTMNWLHVASYEDRIRTMGVNSLKKLQNRYQYTDLDNNEYIPDIIKEKLGKSSFICYILSFFMTYVFNQ